MSFRAPAIPLITVDPYVSVWSRDAINDKFPEHWTGARNAMLGLVTVDGVAYRFLGQSAHPALPQTAVELQAMSSRFTFEGAGIRLQVCFTSPLLIDDLYYASRPVSYIHLSWESTDGQAHTVTARLTAGEELCLNRAGEGRALAEKVTVDGVSAIRMGRGGQTVLNRCGDDVRIDWGYLYLGVRGAAECGAEIVADLYAVYAETAVAPEALFLVGYDDIDSLLYFGEPVRAYWKKDGTTIEAALSEAAADYETLCTRCEAFSQALHERAVAQGGEEYATLLLLAYRQVMAAHKLAVDKEGNNLFISRECFSNGCAATVDVTYPSAPLFLLYNTELLKGMLRPIFRFAASPEWKFTFAPHDVGTYPFLNGQVYAAGRLEGQMPVEECGNVLILVDAVCRREGDYTFAKENFALLQRWSRYLVEYGEDPANQLCTDDFAGHLSHNVNLAVKAVMGLAGFADILSHLGQEETAAQTMATARRYADSLCARAQNADGSYRLAFDRPDTFSLKYNAVWDKLWNTQLFPARFYAGEMARYKKELLPYGVPLDSRSTYTKSDWLVWAACLSDDRADFEQLVHALYMAYHTMHTRVPLTDWYYADTSDMVSFRNRTVQGGLFIKLLFEK